METTQTSQSSLGPWILALRPKTLSASVIPILVGTSVSFAVEGQISGKVGALALICSALIQFGTNLINDAVDFKKGADTEERTGPRRLIQSGVLSARQTWWVGVSCFLMSVLFGIPLVQHGGWPIVMIGLASCTAGYLYTGGPYPLAYLGLGDLFVLIFFGWVAVNGIFFLHTGHFGLEPWVAGTQVGCLSILMIAINNSRDYLTDRKIGKMTLPARLGLTFGRFEIAVMALLPFLLGVFWMQQGLKWGFLLPWVALPLSVSLVRKIFTTEPGSVYNQLLAQAGLLGLVFGILLSIGLCLR